MSRFGRGMPHSFGKDVSQAQTLAEALHLGGVDFEIEKVQAGYVREGNFVPSPDEYFTVRKDNGLTLGRVGKNYVPVSNEQLLGVANELAKQGAKFSKIWTFGGGAKICLQQKLPFSIRVGGRDLVEPFITLINGHDGKTALQEFLTPVRMACTNQVIMARSKAIQSLYLRHTQAGANKLEVVPDIVGASRQYFENYERAANILVAKPFRESDVLKFVEQLFPNPEGKEPSAQTINRRERVRALFASGDGHVDFGIVGTAWAALQAAIQFADRELQVREDGREDDARAHSIFFGQGAKLKSRAAEIITQMTGEEATAKYIVPLSVQ